METVTERTTTIRVTGSQWQRLNALKLSPGETMTDVVERLLSERRQGQEAKP
jgi:predicted CopG family antitoxin